MLQSFADLDDEETQDPSVFSEDFSREELEKVAINYISNYFSDKISNSEGKFPANIIFSPKYIDLVLNTNICDGVDLAYKAIENSGKFDLQSSDHLISEDIRYVIKTLGVIKKYGIPQEYAAGILLMHLEIIEGIKLLLSEI